MRLGALLPPTLANGDSRALAEASREIAGSGYAGIWTVQAAGRGSFLPDPLMALAVAANVTQDIELGTAILQVPLYGVVDLAHRLLSLEMTAGDRIRLGVGAGSTQTDFDAYERDYDARFRVFRESVGELRELLTTGRSTRLGVDLNYRPREPIPLLLGSWGKGAITAANDYDGWIASGAYRTPDEIAAALAVYRDHGGARALVSTIVINSDDVGLARDRLAAYAEMGVDDAIVMVIPGTLSLETVRGLVAE